MSDTKVQKSQTPMWTTSEITLGCSCGAPIRISENIDDTPQTFTCKGCGQWWYAELWVRKLGEEDRLYVEHIYERVLKELPNTPIPKEYE